MNIENALMKMDFSKFSRIKESLLEELLRINRRQKSDENFSDCEMTEEELDEVAAAGNPNFETETKEFSHD